MTTAFKVQVRSRQDTKSTMLHFLCNNGSVEETDSFKDYLTE